jgi:hypothetical protein
MKVKHNFVYKEKLFTLTFFYWRTPQQKLRTHRSLEGLLCNPVMKMMRFFLPLHFNGVPVEWNWQGKTEVPGEKPVPVPLCPPQIPHGPTLDRTRVSAMRGRRLTAWAMARPYFNLKQIKNFLHCKCETLVSESHLAKACGTNCNINFDPRDYSQSLRLSSAGKCFWSIQFSFFLRNPETMV